MKPLHFLFTAVIGLSLTACGSSAPATPEPTPTNPKTPPAVEQPMAKNSTDIKDLRMEEALTDLDKVE